MNLAELISIERESIRAFVARVAPLYLWGRVLDFGCGHQPYRSLVERGSATYVGYDRAHFPASAGVDHGLGLDPMSNTWDGILCTQVVEFVPDVAGLLVQMHDTLRERQGYLVLTYPSTWPEINKEDIHRFTFSGMERLLIEAGFEIVEHSTRAVLAFEDFTLPYGGGIVGRAV